MTDGTTSGNSQLSHADIEAMRGTAKWARFLAIVFFVVLGLMLIVGIFAGSMLAGANSMADSVTDAQMEQLETLQDMEGVEGVDMEEMQRSMEQAQNMRSAGSAMGGTMMTIMIVLIVALYFFPTLLLYQFATRTLKALDGPMDNTTFTAGLNAHRRYYKFIGILMIIMMAFYALAFLVGGMGAMMM